MVRNKQKRKLVNRRRNCLFIVLAFCLGILVLGRIRGSASVLAKEGVEIERTEHGDVSMEDLRFSLNGFNRRMRNVGAQEPSVVLEKTAEWVDIEEGLADITITERDDPALSNVPVDYIFILDRTRTMSLNESTFEGGSGQVSYQLSNSPCINPDHYYYKGGIYLWLKDYFTGYDYVNGVWFENLAGDAEFWNRHYNEKGEKIQPLYANGCQDRLSMAKLALHELVDKVAEENEALSPNAMKSRIAFWSFGDGFWKVTGDKRDQGLYNYVPWTADYKQVQEAVSQVKTYSGTYYLESLKEAYEMITTRNASDPARKNVYTKIVFLSDGECSTQVDEVLEYAKRLKELPNTEVFTLAIGMTADSSGTRLLQQMSSGSGYTASFWQSLSFDGGKGSALAQALLQIDEKGTEVKAVEKVLKDQIETEYWEPVQVISASGGVENTNLDLQSGVLTWNIPDGPGQTYTCKIRIKLRDEYRYLLSDTAYPTNRYKEGADEDHIEKDPSAAGAKVTYTVNGGPYHGQEKQKGVITPYLKYGTVAFDGIKTWTVEGAEGDLVSVHLMRKLPQEEAWTEVNACQTDETKLWKYGFQVRAMADGTTRPLIKYNEKGSPVSYEVTEDDLSFYTKLNSLTEEQQGGSLIHTVLYNEPYKIQVEVHKVDEETKNPLCGAEFSICSWSEKENAYVPYYSTTDYDARPYESGMVKTGEESLVLVETEKGIYKTPAWIYYTPDNCGRFRLVETRAPEGYYGDWKEGTKEYKEADKKVYDFQMSEDAAKNGSVILVAGKDNALENQRVKGSITFIKQDEDTGATIAQGEAQLKGAVFRLYAAEDIVHQDGTTGILYHKDDEIKVSKINGERGHNRYTWDVNGKDALIVGDDLRVTVEDLELGNYYLQEVSAGEGYLVDPDKYEFQILYQDEKTKEVSIGQYPVRNQVKKQALSFYKLTGTDMSTRLHGLAGAEFSIYPLWLMEDIAYKELSDGEVVQEIIDRYRNPTTLGYESFLTRECAYVYSDGMAHAVSGLVSDEDGIVTTPELPYGSYVVVETKVPKDMLAVKPFIIRVTGDDQDQTVEGDGKGSKLSDLVMLMDKPIKAVVRIEKVDSESKEVVLKAGASYVIRDVEGAWFRYYTEEMTTLQKAAYKLKYGNLVVQHSEGEAYGSKDHPYTTRWISSSDDQEASVYVETPEALPAGIYELEEITAPEGYVVQGAEGIIAKDPNLQMMNQTYYEEEEAGRWEKRPQGHTKFVVSSQEAVFDERINSFVVVARQQNMPAIGKISVYAEGEQLVSVTSSEHIFQIGGNEKWLEFQYGKRPIEGAEIKIHAAEDIYSQEGHSNAKKLFSAGELVITLVTDENGQTWTGQEDWHGTDVPKGLPLGKYTVTLTKVPDGYALSKEDAAPREIEIKYEGQNVPVIYRNTEYLIPRKKARVQITKQDVHTKEGLGGALFGLYAGEDIANENGIPIVKAGTLIESATSGVDGTVTFTSNLPGAVYYAKEMKSPEGYLLSDEMTYVDVENLTEKMSEELCMVNLTFYNEPVQTISKEKEFSSELKTETEAVISEVEPAKTGDEMERLWSLAWILLLLSAAGIGLGIMKKRAGK